MEKQLKCVRLLSLKEMALRRVAALLCSGSDILASISKFRYNGSEIKVSVEEWRENIEDKIKYKVLKLELPELLTKQVIEIARPIGLQIIKWKEWFLNHVSNEIEEIILSDSAKLCWNTAGLIEYRKMAEELVCCDLLDVVKRYKLACINCLEDYIPLLWEELPEEKKDYFYNKVLGEKSRSAYLDFCWPHIIKGQLSTLNSLSRPFGRNVTSFNQWAFKLSAENNNKIAVEYFFQKLTHEEREASLMRTALDFLSDRFRVSSSSPFHFRHEQVSDVFFHLLSVMTPEQQMEIFKACPIDVLWHFLHWPRRDLFLDNAGLFWSFLTPTQYRPLLQFIDIELRNSETCFLKLFPEFFKQSPLDFKKYFVDDQFAQFTAYRFLSTYLKSEDSESIEVIFRNVDAADRVKLVFQSGFLFLSKKFLTDKLHMVKVCLREATLSKEDRRRWMEAFVNYLEKRGIEWGNPKLKRFLEFLDETDASTDERQKARKRKHEN